MTGKCNRRDFLKKGLIFSAATLAPIMPDNLYRLFGNGNPSALPDLVAVKNGEPDTLFDKAIKAIGGISRFVKKGQTVVIKPNIAWNRGADTGANTNPLLVQRIVEHCKQAGAKRIYVFDHSIDHEPDCYKHSGIEQAASSAGALVVPGNQEKNYQEVSIPNAKKLKKTKVHELILESDVYISVPVLKHHSYTTLTLAMKNQMGVVWDRMEYHNTDLHRCISDFCHFKIPDLNIMDAYRVTMRNGPQRAGKDDLALMKTLLISTDIVAIDAAASKLFGKEPRMIRHVLYGNEDEIGNMSLEELHIKKIELRRNVL
ncbi:MAG: DUF362 domain-containing protein [Candidatus Aminicenantes bacterium]|nr:DUF362 domain-containing protein [Candidatus Aminicenantes bacterium]